MNSVARYCSLGLCALLGAAVMPARLQSQSRPESEDAFQQLRSLIGNWEGVYDGTPIKVQYTLTAGGSAVMLVEQPGDSTAMVTMFTVDGDRLIATHYCSARNQPQMASTSARGLHSGITFSLVRVTGLKRAAEDWHNTGLTVKQDDADHLTHEWTYSYKGNTGTRVFHFVRKR
jgi:hypothetical protein